VIAGMVLDGANTMLGAGLFIHRKTKRIMAIVVSCASLNILLNIIFVPRIGILGAAIATLITYMVNSLLFALAGRRLLPVKLPWSTMARAAAAATVMYLALIHVLPGHRLLTVAVRVAVGGVIYTALVSLIDPDARALVRTVRESQPVRVCHVVSSIRLPGK
jgi:O-antigen/teichoic acid export membrane protein